MSAHRTLAFLAGMALLAACGDKTADQPPPPSAPAAPQKVGELGGLKTPESIRYSSRHDVWFVSNINGIPSEKDGNGFITRASGDRSSADATVDTTFIAGGRNGVVLNAPKGLAISGDTLWVADIDAIRGFDATTGAPLATIDLKPLGAVFLNDLVVGPDGALYITDSGIRFTAKGMTHPGPDRIFRASDGKAAEVARFTKQEGPNGIAYDAERGNFVIAPFAATTLFHWTQGAAAADSFATGPGGYDGIEVLADGRILISSWNDSTVYALSGSTMTPFIRGVPSPADIGVDTTRGLLAIPIFEAGRVEFWTIPVR